MTKSATPIPHGYHTITPYLTIRNAVKAIEFYKKAFGAEEMLVMPGPDGKIMHAQIKIGDSIIMMSDEHPEAGNLSPESRGGATSSLMLYCANVDTTFDQAVKAGCTVKMPVNDQFWGDRFGVVTDPFGHVWSMATHIEDLSPEEMRKRSEIACKQMAAKQS